jgi:hypothetical protein
MLPGKMSQHSSSTQSPVGRILLWVAIVISLALLGFVTALTIRNNPYLSDAQTNGISKYKFLEGCKEEMQRQLDDFATRPGGLRLNVAYTARDLVGGITEGALSAPAAGSTQPTRSPGWSLSSDAKLLGGNLPTRLATFNCQYAYDGKALPDEAKFQVGLIPQGAQGQQQAPQ